MGGRGAGLILFSFILFLFIFLPVSWLSHSVRESRCRRPATFEETNKRPRVNKDHFDRTVVWTNTTRERERERERMERWGGAGAGGHLHLSVVRYLLDKTRSSSSSSSSRSQGAKGPEQTFLFPHTHTHTHTHTGPVIKQKWRPDGRRCRIRRPSPKRRPQPPPPVAPSLGDGRPSLDEPSARLAPRRPRHRLRNSIEISSINRTRRPSPTTDHRKPKKRTSLSTLPHLLSVRPMRRDVVR